MPRFLRPAPPPQNLLTHTLYFSEPHRKSCTHWKWPGVAFKLKKLPKGPRWVRHDSWDGHRFRTGMGVGKECVPTTVIICAGVHTKRAHSCPRPPPLPFPRPTLRLQRTRQKKKSHNQGKTGSEAKKNTNAAASPCQHVLLERDHVSLRHHRREIPRADLSRGQSEGVETATTKSSGLRGEG